MADIRRLKTKILARFRTTSKRDCKYLWNATGTVFWMTGVRRVPVIAESLLFGDLE